MNSEVKKAIVRKEKFNLFLWNFFLFNIGKLGMIFFILSFVLKDSFELYVTLFVFYLSICVNETRIDYLEKKIENLLKDENII